MNNMLISESPLLVIPSLAKKIGLNEAIILQQIHFWLNKKKHKYDGRYWVYNTYDEWVNQFPFWSKATIRRAIKNLEDKGLVESGNFNKMKLDRTKWYTINYQEIAILNRPSAQNEQSTSVQNEQSTSAQNEHTNNQRLPKTNSKTNNKDIVEIINYLNDVANKNFRTSTKAHHRYINARLREGFTIDDCKKVIDIKTAEWKNDHKMQKFLRPETLFGTKFESYLNQRGAENQRNTQYDGIF